VDNLAGFAVSCTGPDGKTAMLKNRLNFSQPVTPATTGDEQHAMLTPTDQAPYQKFRWIDFSSSAGPGSYTYAVQSKYFLPGGSLSARDKVRLTLDLGPYQPVVKTSRYM
jgi:hypothetical protein